MWKSVMISDISQGDQWGRLNCRYMYHA